MLATLVLAAAQSPVPAEGLELLVAARVEQPVAIDFGPDGFLWVAEAVGGGRVRAFADRDGDGVFSDLEVEFPAPDPTALRVTRNRVLVATSAGLWTLSDYEADGIFRRSSIRHGSEGVSSIRGSIVHSDRGDRTIADASHGGRRVRAAVASAGGGCHDDFGNRFGCAPGALAWHYPFALEDIEWLAPELDRPERLRVPLLPDDTGGSARGPCIYRARALGEEYAGNLFVCDPGGGRVQRLLLDADGLSFKARAADDLVRGGDEFRPVEARTGPDGALWIVDASGVIWRVVPAGDALVAPWKVVGLDALELVELLESDMGPVRDFARTNANALRSDEVRAAAARLVFDNERPPVVRFDAARVLARTGGLHSAGVARSMESSRHPALRALVADRFYSRRLEDEDAHVRLAVLRELARRWDGRPREPRFAESAAWVARLIVDPATDDRLRWAAASIGRLSPHDVLAAALRILDPPPSDEVFGALVDLGFEETGEELLGQVLDRCLHHRDTSAERARRLLAMFCRRMDLVGHEWNALAERAPAYLRIALSSSVLLLREARAVALDRASSRDERADAVSLLMRMERERPADAAALSALLDPAEPATLRAAALDAFARDVDAEHTARLLERWLDLDDGLRAHALGVLLAHDERIRALLHHAQRDLAVLQSLDKDDRDLLLTHESPDIAAAALELFGE